MASRESLDLVIHGAGGLGATSCCSKAPCCRDIDVTVTSALRCSGGNKYLGEFFQTEFLSIESFLSSNTYKDIKEPGLTMGLNTILHCDTLVREGTPECLAGMS